MANIGDLKGEELQALLRIESSHEFVGQRPMLVHTLDRSQWEIAFVVFDRPGSISLRNSIKHRQYVSRTVVIADGHVDLATGPAGPVEEAPNAKRNVVCVGIARIEWVDRDKNARLESRPQLVRERNPSGTLYACRTGRRVHHLAHLNES
jgi:hypothetical protein